MVDQSLTERSRGDGLKVVRVSNRHIGAIVDERRTLTRVVLCTPTVKLLSLLADGSHIRVKIYAHTVGLQERGRWSIQSHQTEYKTVLHTDGRVEQVKGAWTF